MADEDSQLVRNAEITRLMREHRDIGRAALKRASRYYDENPSEGGKPYFLAQCVIQTFFGEDWFMNCIWRQRDPGNYFFADAETDLRPPEHGLRVTEFGELLFNCRLFSGFEAKVEQMRSDPTGIEGYINEFQVARMGFGAGYGVRFGVDTGVSGQDYDLAFWIPGGLRIACEAKCKLKGTKPSRNTIRYTLDHSRTQLPPDGPGMIVVQVPSSWVDDDFFGWVEGPTARFLGNTTRVLAVLYYAFYDRRTPGRSVKTLSGIEFINRKSPHAANYPGEFFQTIISRIGYSSWIPLAGEPHPDASISGTVERISETKE